MGVIELHPRRKVQQFGTPPTMERTFLDTPDLAVNLELVPVIGEVHPENAKMICTSVDETTGYDGDPDKKIYSVSYAAEFSNAGDPDPLLRADQWAITIGNAQVPCTRDRNGDAIVNSARCLIQGLKRREAMLRMQVSGNRENFPLDTHKTVANKINSTAWAGGAAKTWLCTGGSAQQEIEMVDGVPVEFWSVTFEFLYRGQTWDMEVADVGFTYKQGTQQRRSYVYDQFGRFVQSPEPLALNPDGSLKTSGEDGADQATPGYRRPNLLTFEIYDEIDFSENFGDPTEDSDQT